MLARLSFWVPSDRHDEFRQLYESEILPIMQAKGLREFDGSGRSTHPDVFSRLYVFDSAAQIDSTRQHLRTQRELLEPLRRYGQIFGTDEPTGLLKVSFRLYQAPVEDLERLPAGPGTTQPLEEGRGRWHTYDVTDGLAGPMVQAMLQDRHGQMWFGTRSNGLSRFDGSRWRTWDKDDGLPGNDIWNLHEDRQGRLWIASKKGLARMDSTGIVLFGDDAGFAEGQIYDISEDGQGRLWFAVLGIGLLSYDGGTWDLIDHEDGLQDTRVTGVTFAPDGAMWVSTVTGVERLHDGTWASFDSGDELPPTAAFSITSDQSGAVWVTFQRGGVARFDGSEWIRYGPEDAAPLTTVLHAYEDPEGGYWFSAIAGAVGWKDGVWTAVSPDPPLPHHTVHQVLRDREGALWFATMGGAARFDSELAVFDAESQLPGPADHLFDASNGDLWIAHDGQSGVSRLRDGTLTTWSGDDGLPGIVHKVAEDRGGRIWMMTDRGAARFDGDAWSLLTATNSLPDKTVISFAQTADGTYWFGTDNGLARWNGQLMAVFGPEDGLPGREVLDLLETSAGTLWIATDYGVAFYDEGRFHSYTPDSGMPEYVLDIEEDPNGDLWFATHGGIARMHPGTDSIDVYTTHDGLASNDVHSLRFAADGTLWIGTDGGGISRFDGHVFQGLSKRDGLPDNVTLTVIPAADGSIWIGGTGGLSRYRPEPAIDVPVFVEAVVADKRYDGSDAVAVPSTVDVVVFEVRGVSLKTRPGKLVYRYRLNGFDSDWHHTTDPRIEYHGLSHGDYEFEVMAVDRDLATSTTPARLDLRVHLPWERLGLIALLVTAVGLVGWQAVRVMRRDARLQETNKRLEENARALETAHQQVLRASQAKSAFLANMSHELRTPLNAIINFSSLILDRAYGDIGPDLRDAVEEIDRNGDNLLHLINDVLDLSKIEAGAMALQVDDCSPEACVHNAVASQRHRAQAKGLELTPEAAAELPSIRADERRLTQQVLVNLVDNAIKFTDTGGIRVGAEAQNTDVHFWVADTGRGIDAEQQKRVFQPFFQVDDTLTRDIGGTGLGLAIVQRFVELHGGRVWLDSELGRGSTFHIKIPCNGNGGG